MRSYIHITITSVAFLASVTCQKLAEQKIQSYTECQTDNDCKPNSFCYGNDDNQKGRCKCLDGYELLRNTTFYECLPRAKLGEPCEKDKQCQLVSSYSYCDQYKTCRCQDIAQAYSDGVCYVKIKLGGTCLTDANCYLSNNDWAYCIKGVCTCPQNKRPSADGTLCISTRKMGEECIADDECNYMPNVRCREVCRCSVGYVLSRNGKACEKAATKFGDNCTEDAHCEEYLKEGMCIDGRCGCQNGFHGYGNKCVRTRNIGEPCQEIAQCIYEQKLEQNVECRDNKCVCIFGVESNGSCKIERKLNNSSSQRRISLSLIFIAFLLYLSW